jgi:hypothetical protein
MNDCLVFGLKLSSTLSQISYLSHPHRYLNQSQTIHQESLLSFSVCYYSIHHDRHSHRHHHILFFDNGICYSVRCRNCFGFWLFYLPLLYLTILLYKKDRNQYQHHIFASIAFDLNNLDIAYLSIYCLPVIIQTKYLSFKKNVYYVLHSHTTAMIDYDYLRFYSLGYCSVRCCMLYVE